MIAMETLQHRKHQSRKSVTKCAVILLAAALQCSIIEFGAIYAHIVSMKARHAAA